MTPEGDDGFTFEDKRKAAADVPPIEPEAKHATEGQEAAGSPEPEQPESSQLHHLTGPDRLLMCVDILQQGAWIAMGLRADPITQGAEANLEEARRLIDCVEFLADKVRGELDADTQRDLRSLVRDLQVNYVQQVNR